MQIKNDYVNVNVGFFFNYCKTNKKVVIKQAKNKTSSKKQKMKKKTNKQINTKK